MNSLISYDWLKEYVDLKKVTPEEFAKRMSLSGPAVEKIIPQGADLDRVVIGQVLEVKAHPNADKLRLALTDVGSSKVTIVCGGSNLAEGQWVVVALVGAKVRWHGEGDLIELKPAEIRGVKSDGMICAANEIGLADAFPHAEREILDLGVAVPDMNMKPGTPIADALGLSSDVVMDVEVTSNRVDAMGMVGMAREASAILNKSFTWKPSKSVPKPKGKAAKVSVGVSAKKLCPRYMAVRIDGVTVGPSPWWLKRRLASAGLNSINNIVDITNFILLELAQPMHAFDAAMIEKGIDVRMARKGEKIHGLDGRDHKLDDSMLVIADASKPVAIAGIIGGQASGVASNTTSIILEAATFDSVSIRRTARTLSVQTDAQLRFEKGLSTQGLPDALARAVELVLELAGGHIASTIADVVAEKYKARSFTISSDEIESLIGVPLPKQEMIAILRRLGFKVSATGKKITAVVPWWRDHDIELARDLVEEIARVYGYANIPAVVPIGLAPRPMQADLFWEDRVRDISKGAGLIETYSYSFVSKELMEKASYDPSGMLHLQNPLTADLEIMRTTLLPSLLQAASDNREREDEMRLFELANVYYPSAAGWKDLPDERAEFGALFHGIKEPWKVAKGHVEQILAECGIENVSWRRLETDSFWHPGRTVQAFINGELVATLGEVSPKISARFKLEGSVALIDLAMQTLVAQAVIAKQYRPLSPFPPAKRDLAVVVDQRSEYDDLARAIRAVDPLVNEVEWFDTYQGKNLPSGKKSVAMHLTLSSVDRTLESAEVDAVMEKIALALKETFRADIRS
ncbi:MAG: phenylalanine--tRNA ligase subunit beta [Patescibacteria group bacterium]|jgi:phenylalanyl-tRNA synthetase beta chain